MVLPLGAKYGIVVANKAIENPEGLWDHDHDLKHTQLGWIQLTFKQLSYGDVHE